MGTGRGGGDESGGPLDRGPLGLARFRVRCYTIRAAGRREPRKNLFNRQGAHVNGIDLVFFDWGGVLAEEGFMQGLAALAQQSGLDREQTFDQAVRIVFATGYVYGRCTEAEFWSALQRGIPLKGTPEQWREAILSRFVPRPWMFALVERLKAQGVRVAVLSDQVNWLDELEAKFGFAHHFEKVFNSYYYGATKSEPEFFTVALAELGGVPPEKALLIDDAQRNIAMARQVGLQAIYYDGKEQFLTDFAAVFPEFGA